MLRFSYLIKNVWEPFGVDVAGAIGTAAIGTAAIGAGADPTELMEDAGMNPETRADRAIDEPLANPPGDESDAEAFGSIEPVAPMIRVR